MDYMVDTFLSAVRDKGSEGSWLWCEPYRELLDWGDTLAAMATDK